MGRPPPPHSGNARKKTFFFYWGLPLPNFYQTVVIKQFYQIISTQVCFLQIPGAYLQPLPNSEGEGEIIFKTAQVFDFETFYFEVLFLDIFFKFAGYL